MFTNSYVDFLHKNFRCGGVGEDGAGDGGWGRDGCVACMHLLQTSKNTPSPLLQYYNILLIAIFIGKRKMTASQKMMQQ